MLEEMRNSDYATVMKENRYNVLWRGVDIIKVDITSILEDMDMDDVPDFIDMDVDATGLYDNTTGWLYEIRLNLNIVFEGLVAIDISATAQMTEASLGLMESINSRQNPFDEFLFTLQWFFSLPLVYLIIAIAAIVAYYSVIYYKKRKSTRSFSLK